jgi:hypothetical protein
MTNLQHYYCKPKTQTRVQQLQVGSTFQITWDGSVATKISRHTVLKNGTERNRVATAYLLVTSVSALAGAAAAGRGGRAPASGGQGWGRRDLAARAAVGAGRGGRAPASRGRGRGGRNPTAQATLTAGQGGRAPARCSRWLGGWSPVARAAGRRRRPEPGGAHCVSMWVRETRFGRLRFRERYVRMRCI